MGASIVGTLLGQKVAPALLDRYLAKTGYRSQQSGEKADPNRPHNLWKPVDGKDGHDHGAHGVFNSQAHGHCAQLWFAHHARLASSLLAGAGMAGLATAIACGYRR